MAFSEKLADLIREKLASLEDVEEKKMMGGLTFMVNGKMCLGILKDEIMVRLHPGEFEQAVELPGCREMDFTGRPMRGFVMIDPDGLVSAYPLDYWVHKALEYNQFLVKEGPIKKKKKS